MSFADRKDQMAGLRRLALRITWDGQDKPAVWCPLGDFFGTAPGENLYKSLTTGMTKDGYYSYWYMPFGKSAVVELVNDDKVARKAEFEWFTPRWAGRSTGWAISTPSGTATRSRCRRTAGPTG